MLMRLISHRRLGRYTATKRASQAVYDPSRCGRPTLARSGSEALSIEESRGRTARPIALGHHRFEWLYATGFVEPASGRTVWNITSAVCKEMFELVLADFANQLARGPLSASCFSSTVPPGADPKLGRARRHSPR